MTNKKGDKTGHKGREKGDKAEGKNTLAIRAAGADARSEGDVQRKKHTGEKNTLELGPAQKTHRQQRDSRKEPMQKTPQVWTSAKNTLDK